jgi:Glutaminase
MKTQTKSIKESAILTVAAIRRPKNGPAEYLFNEKQRIFELRSSTRTRRKSSAFLEHAVDRKVPVRAVLDSRRSVIERIEPLSREEVAEFRGNKLLLEDPERSVRIDVKKIDPTVFNLVDYHLKFRCFRRCRRIIPDYKTAKKIFDFCAQQSCNLGGPFSVTPCIPFQYVRDGCYARAHKMRWIITTKYRYCCEKVFSFANQNNDRLAVKADKWGGCCVTWWYHVVPLVRVRLRIGRFSIVLAMVFDPGMFDKPVLLSTWLAAQENTACSSNAHVSMYSIQPGSAYTPANYTGTAFSTDPSYSATNATLINYKNLTTCP